MKITIEVETDTEQERVESFVKQFCKENFIKECKINIEK